MVNVNLILLAIAIVASWVSGCSSKPQRVVRNYHFEGKIVSVDKDRHEVVVDHKAIPGFMEAMTMPYKVKSEAELSKLKPGQTIDAELVVNEDASYYLQHIEIRAEKSAVQPSVAASEFHMPEAGQHVPDFQLIDQDGRHFRLKDRYPALVTFIYARCPLPDFCPRMNENFKEVAKAIANTESGDLHLITISFDPEHDSPAILRQMRDSWATTPDSKRRWTFGVPSHKDMRALLTFFGVTVLPDSGSITHSLSTTLISPSGVVRQWWSGNDWTPEQVRKALSTRELSSTK